MVGPMLSLVPCLLAWVSANRPGLLLPLFLWCWLTCILLLLLLLLQLPMRLMLSTTCCQKPGQRSIAACCSPPAAWQVHKLSCH